MNLTSHEFSISETRYTTKPDLSPPRASPNLLKTYKAYGHPNSLGELHTSVLFKKYIGAHCGAQVKLTWATPFLHYDSHHLPLNMANKTPYIVVNTIARGFANRGSSKSS